MNPFSGYIAIPSPEATNLTRCASEHILNHGQTWVSSHDIGSLEKSEPDGLFWKGAPYIAPFLRTATNQAGFLLAGLAMQAGAERPLPAELVR